MFSQVDDPVCATPDPPSQTTPSYYSNSTDPAYLASMAPQIINVFFWKINDPNGNYSADFEEKKLLEAVALMNMTYNPMKIFFKYRGYDEFDSPANLPLIEWEFDPALGRYRCINYPGQNDPDGYEVLGRCQIGSMFDYAANNGYKKADALNFYIPSGTDGFGGAARSITSIQNAVRLNALNDTNSLHEIGHNLGLPHTRSSNEHATRIEFLPNGDPNIDFNARTKGDEVVDTAANSGFYFNPPVNGTNYPYINLAMCEYIGDETDAIGALYEIFPEDVKNIMSNCYPCSERLFTTGQGIKMLETIINSPILNPIGTDFASLYEPYIGTYYWAGPDTTKLPLFQPGFTYTFPECSGDFPQPAPYGINFNYNAANIIHSIAATENDYDLIYHPNHSAIFIKEVDVARGIVKPEKCYNNNNRKPNGGSVMRFNDDAFNSNVTITPKDSIGINNQNLIPNLQPGLYKLQKTYPDGSAKETVIIKQNN